VADDVLALIDELDELVHHARTVPLSEQVRLDRETLYGLLDRIRDTLPEQTKQARFLVREREEMLAEAQREAHRLRAHAHDEAAEKTSQREITRIAERQADEILANARWQAERKLQAVDDWADGILKSLERNLEQFQQAIRRGRQHLHDRSQEAATLEHNRDSRAA
jgi:hypothetical protein